MSIELVNFQENGRSTEKMTQIQPILPDNVEIDEPNARTDSADFSHISLHQVNNAISRL